MKKLEIIYELQKTIEQLYQETDSFEIHMKEMLALITAKRLMPDMVLQRAWEQLDIIRKLGNRCREEYGKLDMLGEVPEYIEQMRVVLTATERLLKEREEYFLAKEEFMQLSSNRMDVYEQLVISQKELAGYTIENMTEQEIKTHLEKYVLFMKAWREKEALRLIDYVQKLLKVFDKELVAAAVFQKEDLILNNAEKTQILTEEREETGSIFELGEKEEEKKQDDFKLGEKQEERKQNGFELGEKEKKEEKEQNDSEETEGEDVSAGRYQIKVENCIKKELKKFGVKNFRSDLSGVTEGLRKRIFRGIRQYGGITAELIANMTAKTKEEAKWECETLLHLGYLRKYKVEGMEELYSVSPKGKKAFEVWEALHFLHITGELPEWQSLEDAKDMGSAAVVRLMLLKVLASEFQQKVFLDVYEEHQIKQTIFFLKCRSLGRKEWRYYTGASERIQDDVQYIVWLKDFIKEEEGLQEENLIEKWVILGDISYGERIKELLLETYGEKINPQLIVFRQYGEDLWPEGEKEENEENNEEESIEKREHNKEKRIEKEEEKKWEEREIAVTEEMLEEAHKGSCTVFFDNTTIKKKQMIHAKKRVHQEEKRIQKENRVKEENRAQEKSRVQKENDTSITDAIKSWHMQEEISPLAKKEEWKEAVIRNYQQMIENDKIYCATAYLYAVSQQEKDFMRLYCKLAYAVNDPLMDCHYSSNRIFDIYFEEDDSLLSEYYMISALLRNYFLDHIGYDYQMQQLYDGVKERQVLVQDRCLGEIIYSLMEFKEQTYSGMDRFADYKRKDMVIWEAKIAEKKNEARGYYDNYVLGKMAEQASHRRFVETKKLIFSQEGKFAFYLKVVAKDEREHLAEAKAYLLENFIKDGALVDAENLEAEKIHRFLDEKWEEASQHLRIAKKSSDLMSSLRMNLYNQIKKALSTICDWVDLLENKVIDEKENGFQRYKKVKDVLLGMIQKEIQILQQEIQTIQREMQTISIKKSDSDLAGKKIVLFTLVELKERLDGIYRPNQERYFYIRFLANDKVLLNSEYKPDREMEVLALEEFTLTKRIELHANETEEDLHIQMKQILDGEDDYGSALLLERYFADSKVGYQEDSNIAEAILYAEKSAKMKREAFLESLELAQSYGQMRNFSESEKEKMLQAVNTCYNYACRTKNFGYFSKVLFAFQKKIKEEAKYRESAILKEMEAYLNCHKEILEEEEGRKRVEKIQAMIELQNYTAAEDFFHRLINQEKESELELLKTDYLKDFLHSYDYNYANVSDTGKKLHTLFIAARTQKESQGGRKLLEAWLSNNGNLGEQKLAVLLTLLGFSIERVKSMPKLSDKIENYVITLKGTEKERKREDVHSIAAFGSLAAKEGFRVICLYGKYDADRLMGVFKEIGNTKHTIALLDYPLSDSERRKLARMTKLEDSEKIFGVIDRVLLIYLVNHYTEKDRNRMLMAVMMPYAYYQPYAAESAQPMPPELFVGRKEEFHKIISPTGVNFVYGGRQLGKSSLLRMAKRDIDQKENGERAVLVDIKGLDDTKAAIKVSQALAESGILKRDFETEDWDELSKELVRRLQSDTEERISYLLLLLDEADAWMESCEAVDYRPFHSLKEVQKIGEGRFKFVAAGVHNLVRLKQGCVLENNPVLSQMESLTVTPFSIMEAKELLQIPLFYLGLRFPKEKEDLLSMILASTNYFPGLLQLYGAKLLEVMKKDYAGYNEKSTPPYEVQESHIKKVLSEEGFLRNIHEKFMVTLKGEEDHVYYMIALLIAYMDYKERNSNGYSPKEILAYAKNFEIKKIKKMHPYQIEALMEEMRSFHLLRLVSEERYQFTRNHFSQMMGTVEQMEEEMMTYMEE